jgi:hypothetical protein
MINLIRFAINHFDTKEISDNSLKKFAEITWRSLIANNPAGVYDKLITDTGAAYTDYYGAISDEDSKSSIKEGTTLAMKQALRAFKEAVKRKEGIVRGVFGLESAVYQEFFPLGLTEYARATLTNVETLMTRMVHAATEHQAELGADFLAQFTDLKTSFAAKRDAQLQLIGIVRGKKSATAKNRTVLEKQLMVDVLTVAANNVGKPKAMKVYFDQSFLRAQKQKTFSGKVDAEKIVTVDKRKYKKEHSIKFYNEGECLLSFSLSSAKNEMGSLKIFVNPHEEKLVHAHELGDIENCRYLNVYNADAVQQGGYKVVVEL